MFYVSYKSNNNVVKKNTNKSNIQQLRKMVKSQKKEFRIHEQFSYRFDSRTRKLCLCYSVPIMIRDKGKLITTRKKMNKYHSNINDKNWKKFFEGNLSIIKDDAEFVRRQFDSYDEKHGVGDEYQLRFWIETYLSRVVGHTKTIKKLSPETLRQNKFHLNGYHDYLRKNHRESEDIFLHVKNGRVWFENYYEHKLKEGKWSPSTIGISYRNIRGFYNYVADRHSDDFPFDILKKVKLPKSENKRDMLNPHEFEQVIDFITLNKNDEYFGKFIMMLRLQMKTGMRVSEIVNIRNRNIDINNKRITIVGKGSISRTLNFSDESDKDIWEEIINKMSSGMFLFYRTRVQSFPLQNKKIEVDIDKNSPTTSSYYLQRFREMREKLGLRDIITSHSLRRYFITKFVQQTNNRDLVRQIVGHSSTRMTDYYMGTMIESDTKTTIDIGV